MSYKSYKVKKGDTLQRIAEIFQTTAKALREYHNLHCELSNLLPGENMIPSHIKEILIREEEVIQDGLVKNQNQFSLETGGKYEVEIKNALFIKDDLISTNETENLWEFSKNSNGIEITITDKKILKSTAQLQPLLEIINTINKSTDHLQLALNKDNTIREVLNKTEILEKWEEIKFKYVKFHEMQDDFVKIIVEQYDKAFQNITNHIKENLLYQVILFPSGTLKHPVLYPMSLKNNIVVNSLLFPENNIAYDWKYTSKETKDHFVFSLTAEAPFNKLQHFKELYEKGYKSILHASFSPVFILESKYFYNKKTLKLENAIIYAKEQMSKELLYIVRYKLSLISHDESTENFVEMNEEECKPVKIFNEELKSRFLFD